MKDIYSLIIAVIITLPCQKKTHAPKTPQTQQHILDNSPQPAHPNTKALTSILSLPGQSSFVLGSTNAECGVLAPSRLS
jgi:hypothetical protein